MKLESPILKPKLSFNSSLIGLLNGVFRLQVFFESKIVFLAIIYAIVGFIIMMFCVFVNCIQTFPYEDEPAPPRYA